MPPVPWVSASCRPWRSGQGQGGQVLVRSSGTAWTPRGALCSSLQPLLRRRPTGTEATRASLPFLERAKLRPSARHARPSSLARCPRVSLHVCRTVLRAFHIHSGPCVVRSWGTPASLTYDQLFGGQCLCLEEGRLHEDSAGFPASFPVSSTICQTVDLLRGTNSPNYP